MYRFTRIFVYDCIETHLGSRRGKGGGSADEGKAESGGLHGERVVLLLETADVMVILQDGKVKGFCHALFAWDFNFSKIGPCC